MKMHWQPPPNWIRGGINYELGITACGKGCKRKLPRSEKIRHTTCMTCIRSWQAHGERPMPLESNSSTG